LGNGRDNNSCIFSVYVGKWRESFCDDGVEVPEDAQFIDTDFTHGEVYTHIGYHRLPFFFCDVWIETTRNPNCWCFNANTLLTHKLGTTEKQNILTTFHAT